MIVQAGKTILVWLAVICVVGFILVHFFSDPVGSAHIVTSIFNGIGHGFNQIMTFIKALGG